MDNPNKELFILKPPLEMGIPKYETRLPLSSVRSVVTKDGKPESMYFFTAGAIDAKKENKLKDVFSNAAINNWVYLALAGVYFRIHGIDHHIDTSFMVTCDFVQDEDYSTNLYFLHLCPHDDAYVSIGGTEYVASFRLTATANKTDGTISSMTFAGMSLKNILTGDVLLPKEVKAELIGYELSIVALNR